MENSIYLALSRQVALRTNMDMIANNIANANTPGFRAQNLLFEEYISDPRGDFVDRGAEGELSFVYNRGQYQSTESGPMSFTENPLDVALEGPGFFGVQGPDGETFYTRAGQFQLDAQGTIVTPDGAPVAGQGGGPIVIPPDSTEIKIDARGFVSNQDGQLGQLMVVEFENLQALEPTGNNLYRSPQEGQPSEGTTVAQGMLEGSNVTPVIEMTRMIETLRSYQSTQSLLRNENERLRGAIQTLTRQN